LLPCERKKDAKERKSRFGERKKVTRHFIMVERCNYLGKKQRSINALR